MATDEARGSIAMLDKMKCVDMTELQRAHVRTLLYPNLILMSRSQLLTPFVAAAIVLVFLIVLSAIYASRGTSGALMGGVLLFWALLGVVLGGVHIMKKWKQMRINHGTQFSDLEVTRAENRQILRCLDPEKACLDPEKEETRLYWLRQKTPWWNVVGHYYDLVEKWDTHRARKEEMEAEGHGESEEDKYTISLWTTPKTLIKTPPDETHETTTTTTI